MSLTKATYSMVNGAPGNVLDYGAVGDGVHDDKLNIQAALNAHTSIYFPPCSVGYRISGPIEPRSGSVLFGNATVLLDDGSYSGIYLVAKTNVTIDGLTFDTIAQTIALAYHGGVHITKRSTNIKVTNCVFNRMGWAGVLIQNSDHCIIKNNFFYDFFAVSQNASDIILYDVADGAYNGGSNYNIIDSNTCNGGGTLGTGADHGIASITTDSYPENNTFTNNRVYSHLAYGIVLYTYSYAQAGNHLVSGNIIIGILGSGLSGANTFGSGIKLQTANQVVVSGNFITNCCLLTTNFGTLGQGGISVTAGEGSTFGATITGNTVDMSRGPCIHLVTSTAPVNIVNNLCSNDGNADFGYCIDMVNADNVNFEGNTIRHTGTAFQTVILQAVNKTVSNISCSNNNIITEGAGINFLFSGTGSFSNVRVVGNVVSGATVHGLQLKQIDGLVVANNVVKSTTFALYHQSNTNSTYSGNYFYSSSGVYSLKFTASGGVPSSGVYDLSNITVANWQNDNVANIKITRYGSSAPSGGYMLFNVGDRTINSSPSVGQPKSWVCTVAGAPGTWVSEGNL